MYIICQFVHGESKKQSRMILTLRGRNAGGVGES